METSQRQTLLFSETEYGSLRAATPANLPQGQGSNSDLMIHVFSGRKCIDQLERCNRLGSLTRMSATPLVTGCWIGRSAIWKVRATPAGRPYLHLHVLDRLYTKDIGSGWLPTPTRMQTVTTPEKFRERQERAKLNNPGRTGNGCGPSLDQFLLMTIGVRLHPDFAETLRKFPIGWTEIRQSATP